LPSPANSNDKGLEKKRKLIEALTSSSTFILKNASGEPAAVKASDIEMFELLDL
jgi:hypothetical protein